MSETRPDPLEVLTRASTVAVVGCSPDPWKPAHSIPAELKRRGWRVIPVNPMVDEVLDEPAYDQVADIPDPVDLVIVFRRPEHCPDVARDAVEAGAGGVWLQSGIRSADARRIAEEAGLDYVENACSGALAARYGITPRAA